VGAPRNDDKGADAGKVYVLSGRNFRFMYSRTGKRAGDQFGFAVARVGFVDGDDRPDFAVGSPYFDRGGIRNAGRITVMSGLNGARIFSLKGEAAGDRFGWSLGATPDTILAGAPRHDTGGDNAGRVYMIGHDATFLSVSDGLEGGRFGHAIAGVGDLDEDGCFDALVSAPFDDEFGLNAGAIRIVLHPCDAGGGAAGIVDMASRDPLVADLDGSGVVDGNDMLRLLAELGRHDTDADLNQDDLVDHRDLLRLLDIWP
jgi:hypothetical protein